jgi:hypothetical protein
MRTRYETRCGVMLSSAVKIRPAGRSGIRPGDGHVNSPAATIRFAPEVSSEHPLAQGCLLSRTELP